jgi:hypothetical protein
MFKREMTNYIANDQTEGCTINFKPIAVTPKKSIC